MKQRVFALLFISVVVSPRIPAATSNCLIGPRFDSWIRCRLLEAALASQTQQNPTKQADSPALASTSTSLVDHTSLADFATAAMNVAGFGNGSTQSPSATTTVSGYAIYSAIAVKNPLDPLFYNDHAAWRRITLSVGTDAPATGGGSTASASSGSTSQGTTSSRVVGVSYLVINRRDLATRWDDIQTAAKTDAKTVSLAVANCTSDVTDVLFSAYGSNFEGLTDTGQQNASAQDVEAQALNDMLKLKPGKNGKKVSELLDADTDTQAQIDAIFRQYAPAFLEASNHIAARVHELQTAPQLSISGQAAIADDKTQPSIYRAQLAYEQGAINGFNLTANTSFDYANSPKIGADTRGARAAVDLQYVFQRYKMVDQTRTAVPKTNGRKPASIEFSGEGDWFQSFHPSYVGQVKLTIPLVAGVDMPLSFSYASSANLLHEAHSLGKFGLTFDLSRIAASISQH